MSEGDWDQVMAVNLKGTFLNVQGFTRQWNGQQQPAASIINISSIIGKTGNLGQANYAASKVESTAAMCNSRGQTLAFHQAGVIGFTKTAAKELAAQGIRVNAILPGFIGIGLVNCNFRTTLTPCSQRPP